MVWEANKKSKFQNVLPDRNTYIMDVMATGPTLILEVSRRPQNGSDFYSVFLSKGNVRQGDIGGDKGI